MRWLAAVLLIASVVLGGCWDRHETNELSIVSGLALDWQDGDYEATAEVINTRAVGAPGQGDGSVSPGTPETLILTGAGQSPGVALAALDHASARSIFWPSTEVILLGQALAERGLQPVLDTLLRYPRIPLTPRVFLVEGTARDLLARRQSGVEITVSRDLRLMAQTARFEQSVGLAPHLYDLLGWTAEVGRAPVVMAVALQPPPVPTGPPFHLAGSAALLKGRLAAWVPQPEARMQLWLTGRFKQGTFTFACPSRPSAPGSLRVFATGRQVHPVFRGGNLVAMDLRLTGRAVLLNRPCAGLSMAQMQQAAAAAVQAQAQGAIAWAQRQGVDIFGWGETVFRYAPGIWRQDLAAGWPAEFAALPVRLRVGLNLQFSGEALP